MRRACAWRRSRTVILPARETTCIDRMQSSCVKPRIDRDDIGTAVKSTGSSTWPGSAAVSRAIEDRHRGHAPSKSTRRAGWRPARDQPAQPASRYKHEIGCDHDQGKLHQARVDHGNAQMKPHDARERERPHDSHPDQDRVEQFECQAQMRQEVDGPRPSRRAA